MNAGSNILADLRFAFMSLRRSPGFTLVAIITLGLGIGANTAAFSILNEVLLRPLPYRDTEQLDRVFRVIAGNPRGAISPADFGDFAAEMHAYGEVAAYAYSDMTLSEPGTPAELASGARVSPNLFPTLGIEPQRGRAFRPEENTLGNHRVVMVSNRFWR